MAATGTALVPGSQLTDSAAIYYTATNVQTRIDKCTVCNTSGGAQTFTIYLVQDGGAPDDTNTVILAKSLNDGETYTCPEVVGHWLNSGETLQAVASAASDITLRVSGIEVT